MNDLNFLMNSASGREAVVNSTIVKSVEALEAVAKTAKDMQRVEMIENGKINVFLFDESRKSENDGFSVYNGFVRQGNIESYITDKYGIKKSTIDKFKMLAEFDKYFYTDEKIIQVLEAKGYGYSGDDRLSSSEYLITGTKLYVSTSSGNDDNDGLTPVTALKTLQTATTKLNELPVGSGILLKRGDIWDATVETTTSTLTTVGTEAQPYVITCYGVGNLPKFTQLKDQTATLTWTDNSDGTWYCTPSNATLKIPNVIVNYEFIIASKDLDSLSSMPVHSWYHDYSNSRLYINVDPATITSIEFAELHLVMAMSSVKHLIIDRVEVEHHRYYAFAGYSDSDYVTVRNSILGAYSTRGISINGKFSKIYNNLIDSKEPFYTYNKTGDTTYPCGGYEAIVINDFTSGDTGYIVENNTIKNWRHASIINNGLSTDNLPSVKGDIRKNILYINPSIIQYGGRIALQARTSDINIDDNCILYTPALQYSSPNHKIVNNMFYKVTMSFAITKPMNIGYAIDAFPSSTTFDTSAYINNNVFYKNDSVGASVTQASNGDVNGVNITSNILYDNCQAGYVRYPDDPADGAQLNINVNSALPTTYTISNTAIKNNILWSSASDTVIVAGSSYDINDYLTVAEAEALQYTDGTVMSENLQIDLLKYLEVA